ncbi:MAG: hypothetical protein HOV81_28325 [Kofleriaceae bacterium]|nr:hypothetical protein [Kofleriaceae bacterium]
MRTLALAALVLASRVDAQPNAGWELKVPERVELTAGAGGTLPIALSLDRGLTISKDAGIVVDLAPEGAVSVKKRRLGRNDAVDPDADAPRFAVALRADTPGDFTLKLKLRFWVCGTKVCRPAEARRTVAIAVAAPPTPP